MTNRAKIEQAIAKIWKGSGALSINAICVQTRLSIQEVKKHLSDLVKEGKISQYPTNVYPKSDFIDSIRIEKNIISPIVKQTVDVVKNLPKKLFKIPVTMESLIRISCAIIAGVCIFTTSTLSYDWIFTIFSDNLKTIIICLALPLFSTFAPEGAMLLWKERSLISRTVACLLVLMMLFSILFDGSMILLSQYNKRYAQVTEQNKNTITENREKNKYDLLEESKKQQEIIVNELEIKLKDEKNKLLLFEINTKEYNRQAWTVASIENNLKIERNKLEKKLEALLNQTETTNIDIDKKDDGYVWLSKVLKMKTGDTEFILFGLFAVFLVIVAPFSAFIALGMWKRRAEK